MESSNVLEIILISHWFGHSPHCMECVLPYFLDRGWQVYHLTDKPEAAARYFSESALAGHEKIRHIGMVEVPSEKPTRRKDAQLCRVEAHWKGVQLALEKLYQELGRKVGIFHTWVDLYSHEYLSPSIIAAAMPAPWTGLYVHPAELRIYKTWKRRVFDNLRDLLNRGKMFPSRLKAFNVPHARKIFFLDEGIPAKAKKFFRLEVPLEFFPESSRPLHVADSFKFPELEKFCKEGRPILGILGFLSKRKGLLTVARVARCEGINWSFIFAGSIDWGDFNEVEKQEVESFLKNHPKNVLFLNRSLTEEEFSFTLGICDVLYIAYENFFHSSGIQLKAAYLKKPIIAGPKHLIAERTRKFGLGWCLPEISVTALTDLLNHIDENEFKRVIDSALFEEFCEEHSPERLTKCLEEIGELVRTPRI